MLQLSEDRRFLPAQLFLHVHEVFASSDPQPALLRHPTRAAQNSGKKKKESTCKTEEEIQYGHETKSKRDVYPSPLLALTPKSQVWSVFLASKSEEWCAIK